MVSLKVHNILDYVAGAFLVFVPALFGFGYIDAARNFFLIGGLALIAYSLCTKYEYSAWKLLPLGVHMTLDTVLGAAVFLAPFLFGYREFLTSAQEGLHYALGAGVIGLVAVTRRR